MIIQSSASHAQLLANRANAQLSTGPTSAEGKVKASLNAVKTGLTGRTVLLPTESAAEYESHISDYYKELAPVGRIESDLVQSIAVICWRLQRIPGLEMAIFAQGQIEFSDMFEDHDSSLRPAMIELQTAIKFEKQLRNLQLQEARLARRREREMAELRKLQSERRTAEADALALVSARYVVARRSEASCDLSSNGFEFSTTRIEQFLERQLPTAPSPKA